jgi:hypothetical protein
MDDHTFQQFKNFLAAADQEGETENRHRYEKLLKNVEARMGDADGEQKTLVACGILLAHSLALRFFLRYDRAVAPGAFPEEEGSEGGNQRSLTLDPFGNVSWTLENPEDDLFEFLAECYPNYREEWLALLQKNWIHHAAYRSAGE